MIMRNGIRSALRSRGRTALFTALILLLTLTLTLGIGMWAYCAQALDTMDESYTSIALVEYMGENHPQEDAADEKARQASLSLNEENVAALEGISLWEETDRTLAALDGY